MEITSFLSQENKELIFKTFKEYDESKFIDFLSEIINSVSLKSIQLCIDQIEDIFQSYSDIQKDKIHKILDKFRSELLEVYNDDVFYKYNTAIKNGEFLIIHNDHKS